MLACTWRVLDRLVQGLQDWCRTGGALLLSMGHGRRGRLSGEALKVCSSRWRSKSKCLFLDHRGDSLSESQGTFRSP